MMNIYDCATYFIAFNRCAHHKPTYTLHNLHNNAIWLLMLKYSAKVFQVFHLARDLLPVSSAKSHIVWHNTVLPAPRTYVKISATHIYTHSTTTSRPFTHHIVAFIFHLHFLSFWCSLCGLLHDCHRLQLFFKPSRLLYFGRIIRFI